MSAEGGLQHPNENGKMMTSWNGLHKLWIVIFWITQKSLKNKSSKLVRGGWLNKENFWLITFDNVKIDC